MRTSTPESSERTAAALLAIVSLAAAVAPVGAQQQPEHDDAAADAVRTAYSDAVVERVSEILDRARRNGLPSRPLADRALEGAAKGVAGDRLVEGMEGRLANLRRSARALGPAADPASVKAGADALSQGLATGDLRRVGDVASGAERPAALTVVAELKTIGVPVGRALDAVGETLTRGGGASSLLTLGVRVRSATRRGLSPRQALRAAGGPLRAGASVPGALPGAGFFGAPGPPVPQGTEPPAGGDPPGPPGDDVPDGPPVGGGSVR